MVQQILLIVVLSLAPRGTRTDIAQTHSPQATAMQPRMAACPDPKPLMVPVDMVLSLSAARSPSEVQGHFNCSCRSGGIGDRDSEELPAVLLLLLLLLRHLPLICFLVAVAHCVHELLRRLVEQKTSSSTSSPARVAASLEGVCPMPGAKSSGGAEPSAIASRFFRYQSAARVMYFRRMGMFSGTPCSWRNSTNLLLPPNFIILSCNGFQESIVVDKTLLTFTPKLRCTPADSTLM